jgi:hypothetical protein
MYRFTPIRVVLVVLTVVLVSVAVAVPEWTHAVGLDFWKWERQDFDMRSLAEQGRDMDERAAVQHRRSALTTEIAQSLCAARITFNEAVESLTALAETSPDWVANLRLTYCGNRLPSRSPDRTVMICYLLLRIKSLQLAAEQTGDTQRAELLAERLMFFEKEARLQVSSPTQIALRD